MATQRAGSKTQSITRSFRDLSADEMKDPEVLQTLAAFGWSKTIAWDDLLQSDRIMLLSEAGTGKTFESKEQAKRLTEGGLPAFFVELVSLAASPIEQLFSPAEAKRFDEWKSRDLETAYFFLDSIDEMELSHGKFQTALRNLSRSIDGFQDRAKVVVTSRPIAIDFATFRDELALAPVPQSEPTMAPNDRLEELIRGTARKAAAKPAATNASEKQAPVWRTVALMPLSNDQIDQMLALYEISDGEALKEEIEKRRVWDFARRPQDLIEICAYWKARKRLGSKAEQVEQNILAKVRETGGREALVSLPDERAIEGAERLALALALTRHKSIRVSSNSLDDQEADTALDPAKVLTDWSAKERKELLQRGIFGFASYGRIRFHHRSVFEFLAARRLHKLSSEQRLPKRALLRLLFGERYGQKVVFPATRPVAAWLALWNDAVRSEIIAREPEALIEGGDPESFTPDEKNRILAAFAARYASSAWRGIHFPYEQVRRFAGPELSPTVRQIWTQGVSNPEIEELLVDIVQAGRLTDCLDIARAVATDPAANANNRVTAFIAVSEMDESQTADKIAASLLDPSARWTESAKQQLLDTLFPKHLSVDQFCELLFQFQTPAREIGGPTWHLPGIMGALRVDPGIRAELRSKVATAVEVATKPSDQWPGYQSPLSYLGNGLAALCLIDLRPDNSISDDLIKACVIAHRCHDTDYGDEKPVDQLRAFFAQGGRDVRQRAYQAASKFCLEHWPGKDAWEHCYHTGHEGLVIIDRQDDLDWLLDEATRSDSEPIERSAAFEHAIRLAGRDQTLLARCEAVAKDPALVARLEEWRAPSKTDRQMAEWEIERAEDKKKRDEAENKRVADWQAWRDSVVADPKRAFSGKRLAPTVGNFWHLFNTERANIAERATWSRSFIVELFDDAVADEAQRGFSTYWRKERIPLGSERPEKDRNLYYYRWLYGLLGVYAEASANPNWATLLSAREAGKAARYATQELNKLPSWFESLLVAHPKAVDQTLGKELSLQLAQATGFNHPGLLSDFYNATEAVRTFFAPRVWAWLSNRLPTIRDDEGKRRLHEHVDRAIAWLLKSPGGINRKGIGSLAKRRLRNGLDHPLSLLWMMALLTTAPEAAIALLQSSLPKLNAQDRYQFAENLFAALGERHGVHFGPDLSSPDFTAVALHQLVRLAYQEIAIAKDIDRSGGGTYSPTARDNAQRGRDAALGALLSKTGPEAWSAKMAMRTDPLFAHFKDRLDHLARATVATEAEGDALSEDDIRQLDRYGEAPPADRDGMFEMMIDRLADIEHDLLSEFDERALLASITDENVMQRALARRLKDRANHAYTVDREAEVTNAKKTDIRLRSVRGNQQAAIELKLANNGWSMRDLLNAVERQLVGQYLQHDECKAGCLLITIAKDRTWEHPETRARLEFSEMIELLSKRAEVIAEELGHAARIGVVGIDLRPPAASSP